MKKLFILIWATIILSGCAIEERPVVYRAPRATIIDPDPIVVYPPETIVGETIIIDGRTYYRHYHNGRYYYHHIR